MAERDEKTGSSALRPRDVVVVAVVGVVGVLFAFWVLHFVAGLFWGLVKLAILIGVIGAVLWLLLGRRRD